MLTITETVDAINAIDTDKDVLLGACKKVLGIKSTATDSETIAKEIIETYSSRLPTADLITTLCTVTGVVAAGAANPNEEMKVLKIALECVTDIFMSVSAKRFANRMREDPDAAFDQLMRLLERVAEIKPK